MKTKLILLTVFFLLATPVLSQDNKSSNSAFQNKNSIDLEVGGYAAVFTIYYERVIINNQKNKTTGQVGYGIGGIPVVIQELFSHNNNHLELGLGIVFPNSSFQDIMGNKKSYVTARIGYRYQKPQGGFIFRAGISPIAADDMYNTYAIMLFWPGISLGFSF